MSPKKLKMKSKSKTIIVPETPPTTIVRETNSGGKKPNVTVHSPKSQKESTEKRKTISSLKTNLSVVNRIADENEKKSKNVEETTISENTNVEETKQSDTTTSQEASIDENITSTASVAESTSSNVFVPPFLTELKKLTYIGASLSLGFWDNFLNVLRHRKSFAPLYAQVERFRCTEKTAVIRECRLNRKVSSKQVWLDYKREPKYYMMLVEICTHYSFRSKYLDHNIRTQLLEDVSFMAMNTIYAIIFFGKKTSETYTVFTANHILYACGVFEIEREIFEGMEILGAHLALKKLDYYDIFEFKVGQMSTGDVMVKYEDVKGDGSKDRPIECD